MKNKKLFNAIVKISLVSMVLAMSLYVAPTNAASLTTVKDIMNRLIESQTSGITHTIVFTTATAVNGGAGNNEVAVTFPDGEDTDWCATAGALTATGTAAGEGATPLPGTLVAACTQGAGASSYDTITITGVDNLAAATKYGVIIDDTGAGNLGTPGNGNDKVITVTTNDGTVDVDSGELAVSILTDDQVQVTATVDPTFTFSLTGNNCDLGSLSPTTIDACIVVSTVSTNANSGYTATVLDDNASGLRTAGGDTITDVAADTAIDPASVVEQFGISTEDSGVEVAIAHYTTNGGEVDAAQCGVDKTSAVTAFDPLTTSEQTYAYNNAPITSDVVELCIAAHSIATTEAGIYNDTLTFIATGTF